MKEKIYKPKKLINGIAIGKIGLFVAIPDKKYKDENIIVYYKDMKMTVKNWHKAEAFRRFHDRFGGPDYTLAYHLWIPDNQMEKEDLLNDYRGVVHDAR